MIDLIYTNEARALFPKYIRWVKGKMLNYRTFERLVDEDLLIPAKRATRGPDTFEREVVMDLIKRFPAIEPPKRLGIIRYLQGERTKKELAKKGKR